MKITLITVAYNSEATIKTTLDSVSAQQYPDLEYLVVDGDSADATMQKVMEYPNLVTGTVSEPDQGIYDAMNKGLSLATGHVIGILNSDDFYLNDNVLNEVAAIFEADPDLDVVLGDVDFVRSDDLLNPVRRYQTGNFKPWMFRFGLMPPHPAVFIRKTAYDRIGLYKLGYRIAADFDLLTRLLLVDGAKYKVVNKTWVRMRSGGASTAGWRSNIISTLEMKRSLRENGLFASSTMLMLRLPYKFFTQIFSRLLCK